MLIINGNVRGKECTAIRIEGERIASLAPDLTPRPGETVLDAAGGAVLPGLHDHHLHLLAYAAAIASLRCGPPKITSGQALERALGAHAACRREGWIRGVGYHESVAGDIDRGWLDRVVPQRPVRIQHRSGQLWIFNSLALKCMGIGEGAGGGDPFERRDGVATGRLYGADAWVRARLGNAMPALDEASSRLAGLGITGVTDASPDNGLAEFRHFVRERECGRLRQDVLMMGGAELEPSWSRAGLVVGPTKIYLREAALPSLGEICARIRRSHDAERPVAVHCVTLTELMLAVCALNATGVRTGDRLEHASLTTPEAVAMVRDSGLHVVTQPNFVFERGDAYLAALPADERDGLYRARSFIAAGVPLGAGSDAPYGDPNPWRAMAAALDRKTRSGRILGAAERLAPASLLGLYCSRPLRPGGILTRVAAGARADVCVLDRPFETLFEDISAVRVLLTLGRGQIIHAA